MCRKGTFHTAPECDLRSHAMASPNGETNVPAGTQSEITHILEMPLARRQAYSALL